MKLTIDIPEEIVTAIRNGEDYRYDLHTSIAQGIPYEEKPQGDLISREALKKTFEVTQYNDIDDLTRTERLIDNAPTVEPFEPDYVGAERLKARQRGYAEGYHNGMEIGKTLNPRIKQGEWIIVKDERYGDNVKCPFCEKELAGTDLNFCCKCGAKLTGSEKMNAGANNGRA